MRPGAGAAASRRGRRGGRACAPPAPAVSAAPGALPYHVITRARSPAGGRRPVRVGDYVTATTPLTTIAKADALEVSVSVPPRARARWRSTPRWSSSTRTATCWSRPRSSSSPRGGSAHPAGRGQGGVRRTPSACGRSELVRARLVYATAQALQVPRSRWCARAARPSSSWCRERAARRGRAPAGHARRARRAAYVVEGGPVARAIGSRSRRSRRCKDGAPVKIEAGGRRPRRARAGGQSRRDGDPPRVEGNIAVFVDFFIRRPVFAAVCSHPADAGGRRSPSHAAHRAVPGSRAAAGDGDQHLRRRQRRGGGERGHHPARAGAQRRGGHALHLLHQQQRRHQPRSPSPSSPTRDIEVAAVDVQNRVSRAAARLPAQVNQTGIVVNKASSQLLMSFGLFSPDDRYDAKFLSNYADVNLRDALKRVQRRGRGAHLRRAQVLHAGVAGSHRAGAPQAHAAGRGARAAGAEPPGGRRPGRPAAVDAPSSPTSSRCAPRAASSSPTSSARSSSSAAPDGRAGARCEDVAPGRSWAPRTTASCCASTASTGVGLGIFQLPTANALDVRDARDAPRWSGCPSSSRRA